MQDRVEQIARICHEANRVYCETLGDYSQSTWAFAPEWQKDSARNGVRFHLDRPNGEPPSPAASHESWLAQKTAEGWKYGPVKNPDTKEHPCFVPYDELPIAERLKDYIFSAIVAAFYHAELHENEKAAVTA